MYQNGPKAIRWTSADGYVYLGQLPGGSTQNEPWGVSGDGSVIIGTATDGTGRKAFFWDQANGMRDLKAVLEIDYGLDLTGWVLQEGLGISGDGLTFVGWGYNPLGDVEAWIARVNKPGDADGDGAVTVTDLVILAGHWSQTAPTPLVSEGDFNSDDVVNLKDFAVLQGAISE